MAKAKNRSTTVDDALLPVAEQPYVVPDNWCWTRVGEYIDYATDYVANGSFATLKENVKIYKEENYALMVKTADFANDFTESLTYTDRHGYEFLTKSELHGGELILSNIGSIGKVFRVPYLDRPMTLASNSVMIKCHDDLDYEWLYYFFLSPIGFEELMSITTGTAMLKFNKTDLKGIALPVPPKGEQQRIVEQIESLFSKLDEAKEKIQAAIDTAEERRESILYKAFRGELTNRWREENNINIDNWENAKVKDICIDVKVGIVIKPTQYYTDRDNGTPAFRSANVREAYIEDNDWVYLTEQGVKDNKRSEVHSGDVLIVRSGNPGTACVVTDQYDGYNAIDIIIAVPNKEKILPDFLCYYTNSPECKGLVKENKRGMALQHFNVGSYSKLPIMVPSLEEQAEIVLILKEVLQKDDNAMDTAEQLLKQIELMKKSILAKAFRGELGTNDPSEESSIELLKQIIANGGIGV